MEKFEEIKCRQCQLLLRENGVLKRGREVHRLKIRKMAEELQRNEERQIDDARLDAERDERDMVIADEIQEMQKYLYQNNSMFEGDPIDECMNKIIKQLTGE